MFLSTMLDFELLAQTVSKSVIAGSIPTKIVSFVSVVFFSVEFRIKF